MPQVAREAAKKAKAAEANAAKKARRAARAAGVAAPGSRRCDPRAVWDEDVDGAEAGVAEEGRCARGVTGL